MYHKIHLSKIKRSHSYSNEKSNKFIRLDKNEYTGTHQNNFLNNLKRNLTEEHISYYPNLYKVYRVLANLIDVSVDNILISSGSDLAIKTVFENYLNRNEEVLLHSPTYAMSNIYCDLFNVKKKIINIKSFDTFDVLEFKKKISSKTKLIIIENPNGFTGQAVDFDQLVKLIAFCNKNKILILIDEAYYEFNDKTSMVTLINDFNNLIISRTFSKGIFLAGIRFGYLIASKNRIAEMKSFVPLHEISGLTNLVALTAINQIKKIDKLRNELINNKKYMIDKIKDTVELVDTKTNFILIKLKKSQNPKSLINFFYENKIKIRRPFENNLLKNYLRVGIGTKSQINKFVNLLKLYVND